MEELQKGDYIYYAQIFKPPIGTYTVIELKVHNINDEYKYFTGCEVSKSKQTYIFKFDDFGKIVFANINQAVDMVEEAEQKFGKITRTKEVVLEEE